MALMIAIQQEFEHNITQQVYVSDNLWKIIKIARDDVQNIINHIYQSIDPDADSKVFAQALFDYLNTKDVLPLDKALEAVKKEASLILQ
jgi:site-specific DNA-adenine methylase